MWLQILFFILIGIISLIVFYKRTYTATPKGFKGPPALPLVGNALDFIRLGNIPQNTLPYLSSLVGKYGTRTTFSLGPMRFVVLSDPQDVQKILGSSEHIEKGNIYDLITDWLGKSILTSTGERWKVQRKLLTPAFHYEILKQFLPTINEQSGILVDNLKEHSKSGEYFDASKLLTNVALDIICETAMGRKVNAQTDPDCQYGKAVHLVSTLIQERIFRPWLHPNIFWRISPLGRQCNSHLNIIHAFTKQVMTEKKKERQGKQMPIENHAKKQAFLDLLLQFQEENSEGFLTDQDILNEVSTFMFAGHDSTAQFFSWALLELGNNPEVQDRVYDELNSIFQGDKTRPVTFDDLSQMNYLEMTIKEVLRLHPVLPSIMRQIKSPCVLNDETVISPGLTVWIFIEEIHRDRNIYPFPLKFDPERFCSENSTQRHPYAFIPFSAGPRNCLGQKFAMLEMKTVLANILRNFVIHSEKPMKANPPVWELTLKPKYGVKVKLIPK